MRIVSKRDFIVDVLRRFEETFDKQSHIAVVISGPNGTAFAGCCETGRAALRDILNSPEHAIGQKEDIRGEVLKQ